MRKWIFGAAVVGFSVAVGCGFFQMLFFASKQETPLLNFLYWRLPYIICPPWAFGDGSAFWFFVMPLLNSTLYTCVAVAFIAIRHWAMRDRHKRTRVNLLS
jgi:hypothetical protein